MITRSPLNTRSFSVFRKSPRPPRASERGALTAWTGTPLSAATLGVDSVSRPISTTGHPASLYPLARVRYAPAYADAFTLSACPPPWNTKGERCAFRPRVKIADHPLLLCFLERCSRSATEEGRSRPLPGPRSPRNFGPPRRHVPSDYFPFK